jgi:hypothetical protein
MPGGDNFVQGEVLNAENEINVLNLDKTFPVSTF